MVRNFIIVRHSSTCCFHRLSNDLLIDGGHILGLDMCPTMAPEFPRVCAEPDSVQAIMLGRIWILSGILDGSGFTPLLATCWILSVVALTFPKCWTPDAQNTLQFSLARLLLWRALYRTNVKRHPVAIAADAPSSYNAFPALLSDMFWTHVLFLHHLPRSVFNVFSISCLIDAQILFETFLASFSMLWAPLFRWRK